MSDVYTLALVLCAFYLHDCSLWLERDTVAFFARWTSRWRPALPHPVLSGAIKGLLLSFRLPPLAPVYLCYPWRAFLSPTHLCPTMPPSDTEHSATPQARQALQYEDLQSVTVSEGTVSVNGRPFVRCQERHLATVLADLLKRLIPLPAPARQEAITATLAATLDSDRLRSDLHTLANATFFLHILCNTLFLYLFVLSPALLAFFSLSLLWPIMLTALGMLVLTIAVEFHAIHTRLWPADTGDRRSALTRICFYPPIAIRANDFLAHRACAQYHPLAVAALLCDTPAYERFARQTVRQLHYPLVTDAPDPTVRATETWFRGAQAASMCRVLAARGRDLKEYLQPPPHTGASSLAYCPRCEAEYTVLSGTCSDCPGIALLPYNPARDPDTVASATTSQVTL